MLGANLLLFRLERIAKFSYFILSTQNIKFYWFVMKIKKFLLPICWYNRGFFPLGNIYFGSSFWMGKYELSFTFCSISLAAGMAWSALQGGSGLRGADHLQGAATGGQWLPGERGQTQDRPHPPRYPPLPPPCPAARDRRLPAHQQHVQVDQAQVGPTGLQGNHLVYFRPSFARKIIVFSYISEVSSQRLTLTVLGYFAPW